MKANLLLNNKKSKRSGYLNIDPFCEVSDTQYIRGDVSNLDALVDDGSLLELLAHNILEYFPHVMHTHILLNWLKKVGLNGYISIVTTDFEMVCNALTSNQISPNQAQILLWGEQKEQWELKKGCVSFFGIVDFLESRGFKITKKRFGDDFKAIVVAQRIS